MGYSVWNRVLDFVFPPKCVFCGKIVEGGGYRVCPSCEKELPFLPGAAAEREGEFFTLCVSPLSYQGAVRKSVHRYKFSGKDGYATTYGKLMADCVRAHLAGEYDRITWVPLSSERKRERGYDQAMLLAMAVALDLGDVAVESLRKARHTGAQSGLADAAARRANVLGAYELTDPALVEGRRFLLIDDVLTTGATISECARVLLTGGATQVVGATLAMTPLKK
ncbi:MAG: ComF family protein [Oscillospiraceae bacterium]|nr:ComF family protein [Oscillospiraceae bacterium]